jgi:hypothetical protein
MGTRERLRIKTKNYLVLIFVLTCLLCPTNVLAISRDEVISIAAKYANHIWYAPACGVNNLYNDYQADTTNRGVSYNWGDWDTTERFK